MEINRILNDAQMVVAHATLGAVVTPIGMAALRGLLEGEIARHAKVVAAVGVQPE